MDVSDIFYFFLLWGGEGGAPRRREGGGRFLLKMSGGKGGLPGGGRGGEGPGGCLQGIRGMGAKYFFFGAERPTKKRMREKVTKIDSAFSPGRWAKTTPKQGPRTCNHAGLARNGNGPKPRMVTNRDKNGRPICPPKMENCCGGTSQ